MVDLSIDGDIFDAIGGVMGKTLCSIDTSGPKIFCNLRIKLVP